MFRSESEIPNFHFDPLELKKFMVQNGGGGSGRICCQRFSDQTGQIITYFNAFNDF